MTHDPKVSVVVAVWGGIENLDACLEAISKQSLRAEQVIVVSVERGCDRIVESYPDVLSIRADSRQLIPQLWSRGIREAGSDVVALTTAHFTPARDWIECISSAHIRLKAAGIGGRIDPPTGRGAVDWATYFLRYSSYLGIDCEQRVSDFAADNGTYKAWVFEAYPEFVEDGFWEIDLHRQLCAADESLMFVPSVRVTQRSSFGFARFVRQRFRHGVQFGGKRVQVRGTRFRIIGIMATPVIPVLLFGKTVRRILQGKRHYGALLYATPVLCCFILAWTAGEVWGYMFPPRRGPSCVSHAASPSS